MLKAIALRWRGGVAALTGAHTLPIVFVVLLLAVATPIFTDRVPPLADYVNHLARMHVLATMDTDPVLARLFEARWAIIPNLIMDVLVPPLARHLDVYRAGQVFLFFAVLLLVTGPMAIHRALHGRLSPWPLVAFPFVYNGIFLFGLMNYLVGLGIALWGVAAWIALRERPPVLRAAVSTAIVLALFFCHLFAVGLYGLTLLSLEAWRFAARRPATPRAAIVELVVFGLPFLPVLPLLAASPTMGLSGVVLWESRGKLDGLYSIVQLYGDVADLSFAALMLAAAAFAAKRDLIRLHPAGWVLFGLGAVVYLAMPRVLFGSWLADQRLPVALFFLLIGFARPVGGLGRYRAAFFALLVGASLLRFVDVQLHWQTMDRINDDIRASAAFIEPGSAVLVAHADHPSGTEALQQALSHAPCVAVIERHALVATLFTVPGKQILDVRPDFRDRVDAEDGDPPSVSQMLAAADGPVPGQAHYWDLWPERYRYVYVLYTHPDDDNPAPDTMDRVYEGQGFQLYRVKE